MLFYIADIMSLVYLGVMDYNVVLVILLSFLYVRRHVRPVLSRGGLGCTGDNHVFYCTFQTPSFDTLPSLLPSCPAST